MSLVTFRHMTSCYRAKTESMKAANEQIERKRKEKLPETGRGAPPEFHWPGGGGAGRFGRTRV